MNLRHFSKETDPRLYYCSHTGEEGIKYAFLLQLDELRERCGFPFKITSGYRSPEHPVEAKKVRPGTHNQGIAADIECLTARQRRILVKNAIEMGFNGIGIAKTFVHVDIRETDPVIWTYD